MGPNKMWLPWPLPSGGKKRKVRHTSFDAKGVALGGSLLLSGKGSSWGGKVGDSESRKNLKAERLKGGRD